MSVISLVVGLFFNAANILVSLEGHGGCNGHFWQWRNVMLHILHLFPFKRLSTHLALWLERNVEEAECLDYLLAGGAKTCQVRFN